MIPFQKIHTIPNLHESVVRSTSSFENWFVTGGYDGNITIHNLPLHIHEKIEEAHQKRIKFI